MDMTNATQAGPTHGLLDLIFGTAEKADKESAEAQMDPIAALVAALEKQGKKEEEENTEIAWTEMEASAARTPADGGFATPIGGGPGAPGDSSSVQGMKAAPEEINAAVLEAAGGNFSIAAMLQKMSPSPEALRAIKSGDAGAVMKLIEGRKAELKGQMPALGLLEKAIEKDGLEKVVGTGSLQQLVAKLEEQYASQGKVRKGASTEDFLAAKGLKIANASAATAETVAETEAESALASALAPFGGASGAAVGEAAAQSGAEAKGSANAVSAAKGSSLNAAITSVGAGAAERSAISDAEENSGQPKAKEGAVAKSPTDIKGAADAKLFATAANGAAVQAAGMEAPANGVYESLNVGDTSSDGLRGAVVPRMAHNITYIAHRGGGQLTMTINPKELGEIQLKVTTNGRDVDVKIIAQNADVANALRSNSSELADALGSQKLNVAGIDISVKAGNNGNENLPGQSGQGGAFANQHEGAQDLASNRRDGFAREGGERGQREDGRTPGQQAGEGRPDSGKPSVKRGPNGSIDLNA